MRTENTREPDPSDTQGRNEQEHRNVDGLKALAGVGLLFLSPDVMGLECCILTCGAGLLAVGPAT